MFITMFRVLNAEAQALIKFVKKNWLPITVISIAVGGLIYASRADAADLGGGCCADLEERIAELEASTVTKGNKKVSLKVYGQVSKGLLFWDYEDAGDSVVSENSSAESFIGFAGEAKFEKDWKAGFVIEVGVGGYEYGVSLGADTNEIYTRTAALYLEGPVGRVTLGQYSQATDGIAEITVANTAVAARMLSLRPLVGPELGEVADLFDGTRGNVVRYDTPILAGFRASASWASGYDDQDVWDIALRWAGEGAGFRMAAGVGYRHGLIIPGTGIFGMTDEVTVFSGSASVMHITSGVFVNGAAGQLEVDGYDEELTGYHLQGGLERKFFPLGHTTLFAEFAKAEIDDEDISLWGVGIVQSIDAAAFDLFVNVRKLDVGDDEDPLVGMMGAKIRF
jgi:hypothetical protein